ncbi:MAG: HAD family hydrolase [Candidatus Baldrarchaeia archaeon]
MVAILLDLDGTLIDSINAVVKSWVRAGNKMGVRLDPNLVREFVGFSPRLRALKYFKREDIAGKFLKMVRDEFSKIWMDEVKSYPYSYTVLKSLRDMKIKTAVISSNFRKTAEHILEHFGFLHFLDAVVCDDEVERGKPAPDIVLEAMKRLKVLPHRCVVVGDTLFDVEAGKRAGARAILVVRKPICLAGSKYIPDYVISSLRDIISVIKNLVKMF